MTATVTAHVRIVIPTEMATARDTTIAAKASAMTRRTATTVSQALPRSLLVVLAQLQRYLASTGRRERRKSASARSERNKSARANESTKGLVSTNVAMMTAESVRL